MILLLPPVSHWLMNCLKLSMVVSQLNHSGLATKSLPSDGMTNPLQDALFLPAYDFTCGLLPFGDHVRAMVLWMLKCTSSWNTMMFDSSELRIWSFF